MELYDIHLLNADGTLQSSHELHYLHDLAAIQAAKALADTNPFQVWRRSFCVYRSELGRTPAAE